MEDKGLFESEENSSEKEENEMVMLGLTSLLRTRYLEQRNFHVAKSKHWYYNILPKYDDYRFKIIMRMDSLNFQKLVLRLSTHQIFHNNSCHLQAPVEFQLAIFLRRIGYLVLKRTFLKYVQVKWPIGEDKQYDEGFKNIGGMENVIGAIDGSHIGLANASLNSLKHTGTEKKELNDDNIDELFEDDDNENNENDEEDRDNENEENQNEIALIKRERKRKREYIMNQIIDP
ncbi:hypothetical protein RirG_102460 [Rhizophagus irregularis DAOM 197198w]|uniref:Uncharacterized protein n=1 Tax=Rhizophagus irregularis (strain DAOM 197198w) TaxID=1432141 RepID=A0A015MPP6_RHIIW|nr:hypothetical protein RirG_102460 [Rhizophagus irregularis DAOM 197198w]